jgi:hypothetical protein
MKSQNKSGNNNFIKYPIILIRIISIHSMAVIIYFWPINSAHMCKWKNTNSSLTLFSSIRLIIKIFSGEIKINS